MFFCHFYKERQLLWFPIWFPKVKNLQKGSTQEELTPTEKEGKNVNGRVTYPGSVVIHLKI